MNAGRRCRLYYSSHREQAANLWWEVPILLCLFESFFPLKNHVWRESFPLLCLSSLRRLCEAAALPVHHRDGAHKRQEGAVRLVRQASAG